MSILYWETTATAVRTAVMPNIGNVKREYITRKSMVPDVLRSGKSGFIK